MMEVLVMLPLYSIFIGRTLSFLKGFPTSRKATAAGYPPRTIPIHLLACLAIVGRYYSRLLLSTEPVPDNLDLGLETLQLATAFYLSKWTRRSNLYKSSFQVFPLLMMVPFALSTTTRDPSWHRTLVKCVEWFLHFRLVAMAAQKYRAFDPKQTGYDVVIHLVSVPVTLALADFSMAIPVYFVLLALFMRLNEWVAAETSHRLVFGSFYWDRR
jgi:hypothetical protein